MTSGMMAALIGTLDDIISQSSDHPTRHPAVDSFLASSWLKDHVRGIALRALVRTKGNDRAMLSPETDNPAVIFRDGEKLLDGSDDEQRELFLRSGNAKSAFYSIFEESFLIVAIDDILLDRFRVLGLENGDYYAPHSGVSLEKSGEFALTKGDIFVRNDPEIFLNVRHDDNAKYLTYVRGKRPASYRLVFDKKSMKLAATGGFDLVTAKALSYLEILEQIGSPLLADVALEYTEHYSPIIRWRALSSLNKIRHPSTTDVLVRFQNDEATFVARGAGKILAQGKR